MRKKYELTDDTIQHEGRTLHRIRALVDIPVIRVSAGDLGGYVESEKNLSHEGNCWVDMNAVVKDDARVYGDALVDDNARVYGGAHVYGIAHVYGCAVVRGGALVSGRAKVRGSAVVSGDAKVHGSSMVLNDAWVHGQVEVYDALVCGGELG